MQTVSLSAPSSICADTGSTHTLIRKSDAPYFTLSQSPLHVLLPNGHTIKSIGSCLFYVPNLPQPMTSSTHHYYQLHNSAKWDVSLHLRALMSLSHKTTTRYFAASNYLQVTYGPSRFHYPFKPLLQPRRTFDPPMPISFDLHMRHLAVPLSQHLPKPFVAVI